MAWVIKPGVGRVWENVGPSFAGYTPGGALSPQVWQQLASGQYETNGVPEYYDPETGYAFVPKYQEVDGRQIFDGGTVYYGKDAREAGDNVALNGQPGYVYDRNGNPTGQPFSFSGLHANTGLNNPLIGAAIPLLAAAGAAAAGLGAAGGAGAASTGGAATAAGGTAAAGAAPSITGLAGSGMVPAGAGFSTGAGALGTGATAFGTGAAGLDAAMAGLGAAAGGGAALGAGVTDLGGGLTMGADGSIAGATGAFAPATAAEMASMTGAELLPASLTSAASNLIPRDMGPGVTPPNPFNPSSYLDPTNLANLAASSGFDWSRLVGPALSAIGGVAAGNAAKDAANAQIEANREAMAKLEPWYKAGGNALNRLQEVLGIGGNASVPDYGSAAKSFTASDFQADPGYSFRQSEGLKALERSAAARGGLLSGKAAKDTLSYSQGLASDEYGRAFDRFQTERAAKLNPLQSLAGQGQSSANTIGNYVTQGGNAQAAGSIGRSNAIFDALGQGMSMYQNSRAMDQQQQFQNGLMNMLRRPY